jgi:hypothetical protein
VAEEPMIRKLSVVGLGIHGCLAYIYDIVMQCLDLPRSKGFSHLFRVDLRVKKHLILPFYEEIS